MKVKLDPKFQNISGKVGNMVFRTYTRPDGSKETRMYAMPAKRKKPFSDAEKKAQGRFATFATMVNSLSDEQKQQYAKDMKRDKRKFNGKTYATLRGYIIARLYAEQKDSERR